MTTKLVASTQFAEYNYIALVLHHLSKGAVRFLSPESADLVEFRLQLPSAGAGANAWVGTRDGANVEVGAGAGARVGAGTGAGYEVDADTGVGADEGVEAGDRDEASAGISASTEAESPRVVSWVSES